MPPTEIDDLLLPLEWGYHRANTQNIYIIKAEYLQNSCMASKQDLKYE